MYNRLTLLIKHFISKGQRIEIKLLRIIYLAGVTIYSEFDLSDNVFGV